MREKVERRGAVRGARGLDVDYFLAWRYNRCGGVRKANFRDCGRGVLAGSEEWRKEGGCTVGFFIRAVGLAGR